MSTDSLHIILWCPMNQVWYWYLFPILSQLFFFLISWRPIALQYCSGSCHTLTWISLEPAFCLTFIYCSLSVTRILSKEPQRETVNTFFSLFLKVEAIPHSLSSKGNDDYFQTIWHRVEEFLQKIISTCLIFGG